MITRYRTFLGPKARYVNEQFIEQFDTSILKLPTHLPVWWTNFS